MPDAAYYRAWRQKNPEYTERERERSRSRERTPEQRRAERERAKERAARKAKQAVAAYQRQRDYYLRHREQHKESMRRYNQKRRAEDADRERHIRREANRRMRARRRVEQATRIVEQVMRRDDRSEVYDPLYEDALSCAILSLVEAPRNQRQDLKEARALQDVKDFVRGERRWRWYAQEIPDHIL